MGLTLCAKRPSFPFVRGADRPVVAAVYDRRRQTKAESFARNAKDPWNLIQVMLA